MSISTPPPPAKKKSGLGCLGCGCAVLVVIVLLVAGLLGLGCYSLYEEALAATTTTPADIPTFTGSPDVYNTAAQKVTAFQQDLKEHKSSTLKLSSDEIDALIANNPDAAKNNIRAFVTLTGDHARVQASLPTGKLSRGIITGRYFNFDSTSTVAFDLSTKSLLLAPSRLQFGDHVLLGPSFTEAQNQQAARTIAPFFSQYVNLALRSTPGGAEILDRARDIEVKDGELIIETD